MWSFVYSCKSYLFLFLTLIAIVFGKLCKPLARAIKRRVGGMNGHTHARCEYIGPSGADSLLLCIEQI